MIPDLLASIKERMPDFSKGQRSIASYVIDHYDEAAFMTAARLGAVTGVSESTVVRFATLLGYEGYPEFLTDLGELVKSRLTSVQRVEVTRTRIGGSDLLESVMALDADCVRKTLGSLSRDDFYGAAAELRSAGSIYVMGVRSSSALAGYLNCYLSILFKNIKLVDGRSASEVFEQILKIDSGDVMIGISFPRYSQRTVKAMTYAKSRGARLISITDSERSPLVPLADFKLLVKNEIISYVDSLVAPMSVINALLVAVGMEMQDQLCESLAQLEDVWDEYGVYEKTEQAEPRA